MAFTQSTNLLVAFHLYSHFFENENKVSLLDRRDFKKIYVFKELFKFILDSNFDQTKVTKLTILTRKIVKIDYYDYLRSNFNNNIISQHKSDAILAMYNHSEENRDKVINLFNNSIESLSNFFLSYSMLSKLKNETYLEELLIEFHNYLSHLVQAIVDPNSYKINLQRANAHLHRAVLDAFKVIIHQMRSYIKADQDLLNSFYLVRERELNLIGILESEKKEDYSKYDIQLMYHKFITKLYSKLEIN